MPCFEIRTMSVEFNADARDVLQDAIKTLGWVVDSATGTHITLQGGKIVLDLTSRTAQVQEGYQSRLNELKRQYSLSAIQKVAKKNMWQLKSVGDRLVGQVLKY